MPVDSEYESYFPEAKSVEITLATFHADDLVERRVGYPVNLRAGAYTLGGISERAKEIKRRRHRRKKIELFKRRLKKATASEKQHIAEKLRKLTPGAAVVIEELGIKAK